MKKLIVFIITILLLQMLTGCWNRKELSTLAIVQSIGFDKSDDDQVHLTAEILKPSAIKSTSINKEGKGTWTTTSQGETVFDAFRNATMQADRKLFGSHNKIIVIGQETAKEGIAPFLDFLDRDHEWRLLPNIFIAKGNAQEIIESEHEQEQSLSKALESLAKSTYATSMIPRVTMLDVLKALASETNSAFIPGVEIIQKEERGEIKKTIKLNNTAIFKKDKLMGWFDEKETRGLLWVLGKVKSGIIVLKSPQEETKKVGIEIIRASSIIKPQMEDGHLVITVEVKEVGNIGDQMSEHVDLTLPDNFEELQRRQAAEIESEINSALTKAQDWGVDIFKFGEAVHRKLPAEWVKIKDNWDEEFRNLEVIVEVDAEILRTGLTSKSVQTKKKE